MRKKQVWTLIILVTLFTGVLLIPKAFASMSWGPFSGAHGFQMMSGNASMMMNGNGPMGNMLNQQSQFQTINSEKANQTVADSLTNAVVDKTKNTISYKGQSIHIVMLGGPEEADGKFVINGLVNPTIHVPKDSTVTMQLINEDEGMPHGVEITSSAPPYSYMSMMQGGIYPGTFIHPIPAASSDQFSYASVTFPTNQAGSFYYICQYPGHAEKGMYGNIIID